MISNIINIRIEVDLRTHIYGLLLVFATSTLWQMQLPTHVNTSPVYSFTDTCAAIIEVGEWTAEFIPDKAETSVDVMAARTKAFEARYSYRYDAFRSGVEEVSATSLVALADHFEGTKIPADKQAYVRKYLTVAIEEMVLYGIPASVKIAQAIHETGGGKSRLAREHNAHFGIKYSKRESYPGIADVVRAHDDCCSNGKCKDPDRFFSYKSPWYSWRHNSLFITSKVGRRSYWKVIGNRSPQKVIAHYKACGYATDPKYVKKLTAIVRNYGLESIDSAVYAHPTLVGYWQRSVERVRDAPDDNQ